MVSARWHIPAIIGWLVFLLLGTVAVVLLYFQLFFFALWSCIALRSTLSGAHRLGSSQLLLQILLLDRVIELIQIPQVNLCDLLYVFLVFL